MRAADTLDLLGHHSVRPESARAFLRRETERLHGAVEAAFARFDLTSKAGLTSFLTAQSQAVSSIETELERRAIGTLVLDWPERRRAASLKADLARLGVDASLATLHQAESPTLDTVGRQYGALYVLEGSRMGGRVLAREVARSADPQVRSATTFLLHRLDGGEAWRNFVDSLDGLGAPREHLLQGASASFQLFRHAALQLP
jgi:heme oxygenase